MKNRNATFAIVLLALTCVGVSPDIQAVNPPPDGGYPGYTTAEGTNALQSLTTGEANTALGWYALFTNSQANLNTAVGAGALVLNNAEENTATGALALFLNTTGTSNTASGAAALLYNDTGVENTAVGALALEQNTTGSYNTAAGVLALTSNNADSNSAFGWGALHANTDGTYNTATGTNALGGNTDGRYNTANGYHALYISNGNDNTAVGNEALVANTTGGGNTAIGHEAGADLTGNDNVCIGSAVFGLPGDNSVTRIKNIGSTPQGSGIFVTVESVGGDKLGYQSSSRRYKEEIKPMDTESESLFALTPVSFRYKKEMDPQGSRQYGLIAEDVAKVNPDLVINDENGNPATLRFLSIQGMMLNEFLKEHRKVEQQQATIAELKKELQAVSARQQAAIEMMTAQLNEQATQIRKVTARIEVKRSATNLAVNKP